MPFLRSSVEHHALPVNAKHLSPSASGTSDTPRCPVRHSHLVWEEKIVRNFLQEDRNNHTTEHRHWQETGARFTMKKW